MFEWHEIDARRNLQGPYTAGGELIRRLIPRAAGTPGLIESHRITLLCICPEIADCISVPADVAQSVRLSREGNARSWTVRLAHGLTDFVLALAPLGLIFENADQADPLDREFFAVLTRRADPDRISVQMRPGAAADDPRIDPERLLEASTRSMHLACYEAARDWSIIGRQMTGDEKQDPRYTKFTRNLLFACLLLGDYAEVEALCAEHTADMALQAHAAYVQAILNARLYGPARRDLKAARRWIGKALALTEQLPVADDQVVNLAFLRNTLALIEMREGHYQEALELLTAGLDYIATHAPAKFDEECVLLYHNRARLHMAQQQNDAAIEDLTALLRHQPGMGEAYLDRGILHRRANRREQALKDFDAAIAWSPPYLEALVNRASLHFDSRQPQAARADVDAGLTVSPEHAKLICLRGLLESREGAHEKALASFNAAIRLEPTLADAWANRATILFRRGDSEAALADLTQALSLREDPAAFYNRARVLESQGKCREAAEDYARAKEAT